MSDWQPIETAPKDGRDLIFWTSSEGDEELEVYLSATGEEDDKPFVRVQIGCWDGRGWHLHLVGNPTHWMPLPAPPGKPTITPALDAAIQDEIEHGPKDIMK